MSNVQLCRQSKEVQLKSDNVQLSTGMRNYTGWRQPITKRMNKGHPSQKAQTKLKLWFTQSKPRIESHLHSWYVAVHDPGLTVIQVALKELNCVKFNPGEIQAKLHPDNASSEKANMFLGPSLDGTSYRSKGLRISPMP